MLPRIGALCQLRCSILDMGCDFANSGALWCIGSMGPACLLAGGVGFVLGPPPAAPPLDALLPFSKSVQCEEED